MVIIFHCIEKVFLYHNMLEISQSIFTISSVDQLFSILNSICSFLFSSIVVLILLILILFSIFASHSTNTFK
ncbi:MAG: hypothetical protein WCG25_08735 [bacterium]